MREASCPDTGHVCTTSEAKPPAPEAIMKETDIACGHHHRVGPHTKGTTQVPVRYSLGRKVAGDTDHPIEVLQSGHFWRQVADAVAPLPDRTFCRLFSTTTDS